MEGRQGMRPAPEQLRAHCQYFSRLGWALFGYMAAMLAVQTVVSAAAALLAPGLPAQPLFAVQGERAADQQRADKGEKDKMRGKRAFSQLFIDF